MANGVAIFLGIILLIGTFGALQLWLTPEEKAQIQTIDSLCTAEAEVFGFNIPIGATGQAILGEDAKQTCQRTHYMCLLINYGWIGYILGGLLLLIGLFAGGKKVVEHHYMGRSSSSDAKHCGECGAKLEGGEKFCSGCGSKF